MGGRGLIAPIRNSLVQIRIGNQIYDAVREPRCKTCMHPARMDIETMIVENTAFTTIAERWSDVEYTSSSGGLVVLPTISASSIRNHYKAHHIPLQAAVQRQLAEKRMQEIGYQLEEVGGTFVDHVTFNQVVLQQAQQRLVRGEIRVEVKDGIAAAKFLADAEAATGSDINAEAWSQAMEVYFAAAQSIMNPAQWTQFVRSLRNNPILKALEARISGQQPPPEAIPAGRDPYTEG
jgi:hypothetical protein